MIDYTVHTTPPKCTGPCNQGRRKCDTPEACQLSSDPDDPIALWRGLAYALAIIALGAVTVLAVLGI